MAQPAWPVVAQPAWLVEASGGCWLVEDSGGCWLVVDQPAWPVQFLHTASCNSWTLLLSTTAGCILGTHECCKTGTSVLVNAKHYEKFLFSSHFHCLSGDTFWAWASGYMPMGLAVLIHKFLCIITQIKPPFIPPLGFKINYAMHTPPI